MQSNRVDRTLINKIYTQEEIENWDIELKKIPGQIEHWQNEILPHQNELDILNPKLQNVKAKIAPIDEKISSVKAQIEILQTEQSISGLQDSIVPHRKSLSKLEPELEQVQSNIAPIDADIYKHKMHIEIKECQYALADWSQRLIPHQNALQALNSQLYVFDSQLRIVGDKITNMQFEINNLEMQQAMDAMQHQSQEHHHHHHDHHHHDHHGHHHHHRNEEHHHHRSGALEAIGAGLHVVGDIARTIRLSNLRSDLQNQLAEQRNLQSQRDRVFQQINYHSHEANIANNELRNLEKRLCRFDYQNQEAAKLADLSRLKVELQRLISDRQPLETEASRLKSEINAHKSAISSANSRISQHESRLRQLTPIAKDFSDNRDNSNLQTILDKYYQDKAPLAKERDALTKLIAEHSAVINEANDNIRQLQNRHKQMESNDFLRALRDDSEGLFKYLAESIRTEFNKFDMTHPTNQSPIVRICLTELVDKINFIYEPVIEGHTSEQKDTMDMKRITTQLKYYRLSGLLWNMLNRVEEQDQNPLFAQTIMSVLRGTSLHPQECVNEYMKFQNAHSHDMRDLTKEELDQKELENFDNAYQKLQRNLNQIPIDGPKELRNLNMKAHAVGEAMQGQKNHDIKFCTIVLKKTNELLKTPSNEALQKEYRNLANHEKVGQPSICKKIGGILLAFVGAVIVAGSIFAKIASFGIASPFTTAGIALGGSAFLAGVGLFRSGMRKGTSQKLVDLENAAKKVKGSPLQLEGRTPLLAESGGTKLFDSSVPEATMMPEPSAPVLQV